MVQGPLDPHGGRCSCETANIVPKALGVAERSLALAGLLASRGFERDGHSHDGGSSPRSSRCAPSPSARSIDSARQAGAEGLVGHQLAVDLPRPPRSPEPYAPGSRCPYVSSRYRTMSADSNSSRPVFGSQSHGTIMRPDRSRNARRSWLPLPTLTSRYGSSSSHSASRAMRQNGEASNEYSSSGCSGARAGRERTPRPPRTMVANEPGGTETSVRSHHGDGRFP